MQADVNLLTAVSSLVAILISAGTLYIALRKMPVEKKSIEVDTAQKYQLIADGAAERALKLADRIDELEKLIDEQQKKIEVLEKENAMVRDWAERLVHQVRMLGFDPVGLNMRTNE